MSDAPKPARRSDYLATLDGWRALAIVAVLLEHADLLHVGRFNDSLLYERGQIGVDIFFAISGLLICWRLMREEAESGRISIKRFYIRRAFRILPAAFAYLFALVVLHAMRLIPLSRNEWLAAAFFYRNYSSLLGRVVQSPYLTGHFWSLSVEEHFYLLLPSLLVFTPRKFRVPVLGALTLLIVVHRFVALQHRPFFLIFDHTDIRLDSLLFPAMLAVLVQQPAVARQITRLLRWWPVLALAELGLIPLADSFWRVEAVVLVSSLMILGAVLSPDNLLGRLLESKPLRFVGRISYSLYLWQQLFFTGHFAGSLRPFGYFSYFPLQFVAVFACAIASYYLLEKPMIRVGHRLAPSPVAGRGEFGRDHAIGLTATTPGAEPA